MVGSVVTVVVESANGLLVSVRSAGSAGGAEGGGAGGGGHAAVALGLQVLEGHPLQGAAAAGIAAGVAADADNGTAGGAGDRAGVGRVGAVGRGGGGGRGKQRVRSDVTRVAAVAGRGLIIKV